MNVCAMCVVGVYRMHSLHRCHWHPITLTESATVFLSCRPSNNPPLASLTRHTLFSDWSKSFNIDIIDYTHQCLACTHKAQVKVSLTMVSKLGLRELVWASASPEGERCVARTGRGDGVLPCVGGARERWITDHSSPAITSYP